MSGEHEEYNPARLLDVINQARLLTFLGVWSYIGITVASTTDEMLMRQSLVPLPLINVQIPVSGFFGFCNIAPWIVVLLHCDLSLEFSLLGLGYELRCFKKATVCSGNLQGMHLWQRLADPGYVKFILSRFLLVVILIILPLLLLLWIQGRFLSYHDSSITLFHRLAIVTDIILLWLLWPDILWHQDSPGAGSSWLERFRQHRFLLSVSSISLLGSLLMRVPDNQEPWMKSPWTLLPQAWLQEGEPLQKSLKAWFRYRNLNLQDKVLTVNSLSPEEINELREGDFEKKGVVLQKVSPLNSLQGRDVRYANLFNAILPKVDFRRAENLYPSQLQGANLAWAQMQGALLDDVNLQGADLTNAQLQQASLPGAHLQGAVLYQARLWIAKLSRAELQGANLQEARLQGADLSDAKLQGTNLHRANLQGANLFRAQLQGADLSEAQLEGANFNSAQLQGAILPKTPLEAARFEKANLDLTDVNEVTHQDRQKLTDYLVDLACSDAYIAQGLASQAQHSTHPGRKSLINALMNAESDQKCRGVKALPMKTKAELRERADASG